MEASSFDLENTVYEPAYERKDVPSLIIETDDDGREVVSVSIVDMQQPKLCEVIQHVEQTNYALAKRAPKCCNPKKRCDLISAAQIFTLLETRLCHGCGVGLTIKWRGDYFLQQSTDAVLILEDPNKCAIHKNVKAVCCKMCSNMFDVAMRDWAEFERLKDILCNKEKCELRYESEPQYTCKPCNNSGGEERFVHQWRMQKGLVVLPKRSLPLEKVISISEDEENYMLFNDEKNLDSEDAEMLKRFLIKRNQNRVDFLSDPDFLTLNIPLSGFESLFYPKAVPMRWDNNNSNPTVFEKVGPKNFVLSCCLIENLKDSIIYSSFIRHAANYFVTGQRMRFSDKPLFEYQPNDHDKCVLMFLKKCFIERDDLAKKLKLNRKKMRLVSKDVVRISRNYANAENDLIIEGKTVSIRMSKGAANPITPEYLSMSVPSMLVNAGIVDKRTKWEVSDEAWKSILDPKNRGHQGMRAKIAYQKIKKQAKQSQQDDSSSSQS